MKFLVLVSFALVLVGCGGAPQPTPVPVTLASAPKQLIIDTDLAADDMVAILYLLSRPDVNVRAITINGTGVTRCAAGLRNIRTILETANKPNLPTACGRETPLQGSNVFPSEWRDALENFYGLNLTPSNPTAPTEDAATLLSRTIESSDAQVTLLVLGAFTNIAETFSQHPDLTQNIEMIYSMGGAVHVRGNVLSAPAAEWNIYCDPVSLQQVLATNIPFTLVPLDATNAVPVTAQHLKTFESQSNTPAAKLASRILNTQRRDIGGIYFWDSLAAVILTDESFSTAQDMQIVVESTIGQTTENPSGTKMRVFTGTEASRFDAILLQTLNGQFQ